MDVWNNGTGDVFGAFTSHNWNGSSVVDYCIASNEINPILHGGGGKIAH